MRTIRALFISACLGLLASCSTYRGWMRPDPHSRNSYLVPVPDHAVAVVVSAPPGCQLDPKGGPVYLGSFIHPDYPLSRIVISTQEDPKSTRQSTQAHVYSRELANLRRDEPQRLADHRKFIAGFPPWLRPPPVRKDPVSSIKLKQVALLDGRRVWISRFSAPTSGNSLKALIPEDGFVAQVEVSLESAKVPERLLAAAEATLKSYHLRAMIPPKDR